MEDISSTTSEFFSTPNLISAWGVNLEAAVCEQCDRSYLLPQGSLPLHCPNCFQSPLTALAEQIDRLPHTQPPERFLPFTVTTDRLAQNIREFAGGIRFAPGDLNPDSLKARLQRIFLPMWLVDSDVQATWQTEAGFDYQVVSHQDHFDDHSNRWSSQQITETRIRWEPRVGRLTRTYHNITAPALEEHPELRQKLGAFKLEAARPYQSGAMADSLVRLPNRSPSDAWPEAVPVMRAVAAEQCQRACQADHFRRFRWQAEFHRQNWTLLLLPVYVTYYLDDQKNPRPILIHGQTGRLSGPRRASMRRAQRTALAITAVTIVIFILSLMVAIASLFLARLLFVAGIGLAIATVVGLLALIPIIIVWQFNRKNP